MTFFLLSCRKSEETQFNFGGQENFLTTQWSDFFWQLYLFEANKKTTFILFRKKLCNVCLKIIRQLSWYVSRDRTSFSKQPMSRKDAWNLNQWGVEFSIQQMVIRTMAKLVNLQKNERTPRVYKSLKSYSSCCWWFFKKRWQHSGEAHNGQVLLMLVFVNRGGNVSFCEAQNLSISPPCLGISLLWSLYNIPTQYQKIRTLMICVFLQCCGAEILER